MAEVLSVDVVSRGDRDADLLILGAFEGEAPDLEGLDEEVRRAVEQMAARGGWKAKEEQSAQTALADGSANSPPRPGMTVDWFIDVNGEQTDISVVVGYLTGRTTRADTRDTNHSRGPRRPRATNAAPTPSSTRTWTTNESGVSTGGTSGVLIARCTV